MSGRRVLVTGGAGFIGGRVVARLLARGDHVVVLDDLSTGARAHVPPPAELVVGDVRELALLAPLVAGADVVVHLAARVTVRGSTSAFREDHDVNLGGTLAVLEALEASPVRRLVYASSMAVYADSERGARVREDHPTIPLSPYGASKLAAEHYARIVCGQLGREQVSLRYFNTWGPGQTLTPYVGVLTIFANALLAGERPTILGDGEQVRDFVHVDDVARATVLATEVPAASGVLNVGTGRPTSVNELGRLVAHAVGGWLEADHAPARPEELRCSVADPARARAVLGFEASVPLDLAPYVEGLRAARART